MGTKRKTKTVRLEEGSVGWRILYTLMNSDGEMLHETLRLIPQADRTVRQAISDLEDEKIIEIKKQDGVKRIKLKQYDKNVTRYAESMWKDAELHMLNNTHKNDKSVLNRKYQMAELYMMLIDTTVKTSPEDLYRIAETSEELNEGSNLLPVFISSDKCKILADFDGMVESKTVSKTAGGRFNGCIISDTGCFMIYNLRGMLSEWGTLGEKGAVLIQKKITEVILGSWPEKYDKVEEMSYRDTQNRFIKNGAILYMQNYDDFMLCFERPKSGRKNKSVGLELFCGGLKGENLYERVYALPMNLDANRLTDLMMEIDWHYKLTNLFVTRRFTDKERETDDADGINEEDVNGRKVLCFVDCDIRRLASQRIDIQRNPQSYIIIHYDFQKGLLDKLGIPKECMRISYTVDEVFRLYIDRYRMEEA